MTSRLQPRQSAPGTRLVDSVPAYHNSGPSCGNSYRTGAVGLQVDMSSHYIISNLLDAAQLTHLRAACAQVDRGDRLHPLCIHGAVCSALLHLQAPRSVTRSAKAVIKALAANGPQPLAPATRLMGDSAIDSIILLRDVLRHQQLLPPFHGLVSCVTYDYVKEHKALPWLSCGADDRIAPLAWGLIAISCASPPILLLNRQPSLMWFRFGHSIYVRWFGAAVPIASAPGATGAST